MANITARFVRLYLFPASINTHALALDSHNFDIRGEETQQSITRVANAAWDLGTHCILSRMARLVTPLTTVYCTDVRAVAMQYAMNTARTTFLWLHARRFDPENRVPSARYAIAFRIECRAPYHNVCTAFTIARFSETYISESPSDHFNLITLCYSFEEEGVYGVLFYDNLLKVVFDRVRLASHRREDPYAYSRKVACPVSTWPLIVQTPAPERRDANLEANSLEVVGLCSELCSTGSFA